MTLRVAALFVLRDGPYFGLPHVDPWDESRDARTYPGPLPVVAHPPCARWGNYWWGGPTAKVRRKLGDDGGCFASALESVRRWGGVIEHPAHSRAWRAFGLAHPPASGGLVKAGITDPGWTCHVEQGHYGHRARKATWLYAVGCQRLPVLHWGKSGDTVLLDLGFHSAEERRMVQKPPANMTQEQRQMRRNWLENYARRTGKEWCCTDSMGKRERAATPVPFRDLLISIAEGCSQ